MKRHLCFIADSNLMAKLIALAKQEFNVGLHIEPAENEKCQPVSGVMQIFVSEKISAYKFSRLKMAADFFKAGWRKNDYIA